MFPYCNICKSTLYIEGNTQNTSIFSTFIDVANALSSPLSPFSSARVQKENSLWQLRRKKERQTGRERLRERREDRWHRSTATATATTSASTASSTTPPPSSRATKRLRPLTEAGGGRSRQKVRRNKGESEARGASPQEGTQWSLTWWRLLHFLCLSSSSAVFWYFSSASMLRVEQPKRISPPERPRAHTHS